MAEIYPYLDGECKYNIFISVFIDYFKNKVNFIYWTILYKDQDWFILKKKKKNWRDLTFYELPPLLVIFAVCILTNSATTKRSEIMDKIS